MVQRVAGRLKLRDPGQVGFVQGERRGIVVRAIELNVAQLVADVTSDRDYLQVDPRSGSALAVYLGDGERLLGTLYVEHEERGYLKEVHRDTLIALADLAVVALHIPDQARRMAEVMTEMAELRRLGYFKSIESIWLHTAKGLLGAARANIENYQFSGDPTDLERAAARLVRLNEEISLNTNWGPRVKKKRSLDRVLADLVATWQSNFTDVAFIYDNRLTRGVALRLDWLTFHQALSQLVANAETAFPRRPTEGQKYRGTIVLTVAGVGDDIVLTI